MASSIFPDPKQYKAWKEFLTRISEDCIAFEPIVKVCYMVPGDFTFNNGQWSRMNDRVYVDIPTDPNHKALFVITSKKRESGTVGPFNASNWFPLFLLTDGEDLWQYATYGVGDMLLGDVHINPTEKCKKLARELISDFVNSH